MFEDYDKLVRLCEKISDDLTYEKLSKVKRGWDKLTMKYFNWMTVDDLCNIWTLLDNEMGDNEARAYFESFVSYLEYASDRMNPNRWLRCQLLLGNALDKLYE